MTAIVMALIWAVGGTGVEISLPKLFGAAVMFFVVYGMLARFAFPVGLRWLDTRATRTAKKLKRPRKQ